MKSMKRATRRAATAKVIAKRVRQVENKRQGSWEDVVSHGVKRSWESQGALRNRSLIGCPRGCDCGDCWDKDGKAYKRVPVGQRGWNANEGND
jgi:hypothetical protein